MTEEIKPTEPVVAPVVEPKEEPKIDDIDRANLAVDRMKRENDRKEELVARQEKLYVEMKLGGKSDGGQEVKEKTEDEKIAEGAKKWVPEGSYCPGVREPEKK